MTIFQMKYCLIALWIHWIEQQYKYILGICVFYWWCLQSWLFCEFRFWFDFTLFTQHWNERKKFRELDADTSICWISINNWIRLHHLVHSLTYTSHTSYNILSCSKDRILLNEPFISNRLSLPDWNFHDSVEYFSILASNLYKIKDFRAKFSEISNDICNPFEAFSSKINHSFGIIDWCVSAQMPTQATR